MSDFGMKDTKTLNFCLRKQVNTLHPILLKGFLMASMIKAWIFRLLGFQVYQGIRNRRKWKGTYAQCTTYA